MKFLEIELLSQPHFLFAYSVETDNYQFDHRFVNKKYANMIEIALVLKGRAVYTYSDGHTELVSPTMLTPIIADMDCNFSAYRNEFQAHNTICVRVPYRYRKHDTENGFDRAEYKRLKEQVFYGNILLIPYQEPLCEKYDVIYKQLCYCVTLSESRHMTSHYYIIGEWYKLCAMLTDFVISRFDTQFPKPSPSTLLYVEKAKAYIEGHYKNEITVDGIATHLGVSTCYLHSIFKSVTMMSPLQYINHYRIREACRLADTTSLTLNEIGQQIGIVNPVYMSRLFKKNHRHHIHGIP